MSRRFSTRLFRYTDYDRVRNMRLRDDDVREVCTAKGLLCDYKLAAEAIADDCIMFPNTYIAFCEGELFCISGVVPQDNPVVGSLWAVGTDILSTPGRIDVLAWGFHNLKMLAQHAPILENWVDVRNDKHIKWLEAMKFTFTGLTIDINGLPFTHFARVFKGA